MNGAIKFLACALWAGAAISSAQPVQALAATTQAPGPYASCSGNYTTINQNDYSCSVFWNYVQFIKLVQSSCNTYQACGEYGNTYVSLIYGVGRKVASPNSLSCSFGSVYELGSCAC